MLLKSKDFRDLNQPGYPGQPGSYKQPLSKHLLNLPRFKGHLITSIPESMRLVCNNMIAEGINNALTLLFSEIFLLNWFSD